MPERINFTKAAIARLIGEHDGGRRTVYDSQQRGLAIDLRGASASYYLIRKIEGRAARLRIGAADEWSVENARKEANRLVTEVNAGRNPAAERKAARVEHRFGSAFDWWMANHAKVRLRSWKESQRLYDKHLIQWKSRRLSSIKGVDVQSLHSELGSKKGKILANRVLSLVRTVFNRAHSIGYMGTNPTKNISKFPEANRERFLQRDELAKFFVALEKEIPLFSDFFTILLLTGARRGNVQAMNWENIDWQNSTWHVPGATVKNGQPLVLHLPPKAIETLLHRYNERDVDSPFVFATRSKTGHLVEVKTAWARIIKQAGLKDVRPHDLRHTLASWMAIGGAPLTLIQAALGHKSMQTTQRYAHLTNQPVFDAVGVATTALLECVEEKKPAKKTTKRKAAGDGKAKAK